MKQIMFAALPAALALATPLFANDSSSAIGLGGLELTKNAEISMDSEDLYLSRDKVIVKYRFTNQSAADVETLVSFPLPPIPYGITGYLGDQEYPDWDDFDFETKVDGKPVALQRISRIEANGKDVSARLKQLGWPERYWTARQPTVYEEGGIMEKIAALSATQAEALVKEGLLVKDGERGSQAIRPNWNLVTYVTRRQIFPASKTIEVEHSYAPKLGGSVGGALERRYRRENGGAYLKAFCVDRAFLKAFDKRRYSGKKDADGNEIGQFYVEHWLDYVLKSGANWKGPIKDFRLVVDKGSTDNLVSFCMDGVKKIGPTQFEVRKTDFEPTKDLNILIVQFAG
jgi:hypothetical protein